MTPAEEYKLTQGTLVGEIRHEVYQKHGDVAYKTAHYFWARTFISEDTFKMYTLVNSSPIQFLVATVTCPLVDITPVDPETGEKFNIPPRFMLDEMSPISIHFEWVDANIPFVTKDILDAQEITYTLP